jgi:hypothetical protein
MAISVIVPLAIGTQQSLVTFACTGDGTSTTVSLPLSNFGIVVTPSAAALDPNPATTFPTGTYASVASTAISGANLNVTFTTAPANGALFQLGYHVTMAQVTPTTAVSGTVTAIVNGTVTAINAPSSSSSVSCLIEGFVALTSTANVKASPGNVYGCTVNNKSSAVMYLQFYNTAGTPTLGTGVQWWIPINAGEVYRLPPGTLALGNFTTGIGIGAATSAQGSAAPSVAPDVTIWYV